MKAMRPWRAYLLALGVVWLLLIGGCIAYAQTQHIPASLVARVLPAGLAESALYLLTGFRLLVDRFGPWSKLQQGVWIAACGLLPYALFEVLVGPAPGWTPLAMVGLLLIASFWFAVLPPSSLTDGGFLALMAGVVLARYTLGAGLVTLYTNPYPKLHLEVLGQVLWMRTGMWAILLQRKRGGIGFGFVPSWPDLRTGLVGFGLLLPLVYLLNRVLNAVHPKALHYGPWETTGLCVATFFGALWILAAAEEFFFRGLLLQSLGDALKSKFGGLLVSTVLFGLSHLWFAQAFPNWRFVALATVAGLFYGLTYLRAGNIRAAMVTHALVVTVFKNFFASS